MEPIRLPSEEEISAAYDQGKEAVVALFFATFRKLVERMQALEDQLAKDSHNSSKPPSSDGLKKKPTKRGLRVPENRRGGLLGGDHCLANGGCGSGGYAGVDGRAAHPAELDAHCRDRAAGAGDVGDFAEGVRQPDSNRRLLRRLKENISTIT